MSNSFHAPLLVPAEIKTARLHLRPFQEEDWKPLARMTADPECVRYTFRNPLTEWQTWRTLAGYLGHWSLRGYGPYSVVEQSTGRWAGVVGIWYPGDWPEPEIKWSLAREVWGKGYATEAAQAIQKICKDNLKRDRMISLILPENEASKKVARRLGGEKESEILFRGETAEIFSYNLHS
jgi:RimJ/RimL family protein N-acetyltransferase